MAEHKHGEMDIEAHQRTFNGFIKGIIWTCALTAIALIFLALVNV